MSLAVVKVDWEGKGTMGEDYNFVAAPEATALGYMLNIPTLIQYPDGKIKTGNRIKITPKGMEMLKRDVPLEIRDTEGTA